VAFGGLAWDRAFPDPRESSGLQEPIAMADEHETCCHGGCSHVELSKVAGSTEKGVCIK
jgi:hypothetical protein